MPGVAVPGGTDRGGHLGVERLPDEGVAEGQAAARVGEHPGCAGLVERGDEGGDSSAEDGGQVGDGELHAEQRGGAEHFPGGRGDEAEPVRDRAREGVGHGAGRELRGAAGGDRDAAGAGERSEHLGEVQRVAGRAGGEIQQPGVRSAAD